jgi:hypothetical protein
MPHLAAPLHLLLTAPRCKLLHGVEPTDAIQLTTIKQSHYRPWQALRVPAGWGFQILRQSAHEGDKVVSPTHRPPLPQEIFLTLISVRGWVDPRAIVRLERLCQWKVPVTQSGIKPATLSNYSSCLKQEQNKPEALDTISVVCLETFCGLISSLRVWYRFTLSWSGTIPDTRAPVSTGNQFQDLPRLRETADTTERCI